MIILTAFRFIRDIVEEAIVLRDQVLARYPHLREDN
jgi:hypothetical protein